LILADTSVWVDHLRAGNERLQAALEQGQIVTHAFVVAELALGLLPDRFQILALLDRLPHLRTAQMSELRLMIEARRLYSLGIGLVDTHLLASVFTSPPTLLWTKHTRLHKVAEALGVNAKFL